MTDRHKAAWSVGSVPVIKVQRSDFVSVPVTEPQRPTRFYGDTFGLARIPGDGAWTVAHVRDPDRGVLIRHRRYAP